MKKIMNTPETFVYDMCHGLALAHPELEFVEKFKIVKKRILTITRSASSLAVAQVTNLHTQALLAKV